MTREGIAEAAAGTPGAADEPAEREPRVGVVAPPADALAAHRAELHAFARSRGIGASEADDVVQETLLRALTRRADLRDPSRARAWLYAIARRLLVDRARRAARERPDAHVEDLAAAELEVPDHPARIATGCECAVGTQQDLKPEYADILRQVVLEERSLPEVAAALGLTVNNATVRLHRARRALRDRIEEHCGVATYAAALACDCDSLRCA